MACLTCPSEASLGDVALILQKTALEAEACIYEQEIALQTAINRPTLVWQTASSISVIPNSDEQITLQGNPTILFNNTGFGSPPSVFALGGIFLYGITLNAVASGTVNDNTIRRITLQTVDNLFNGSPIDTVYYTVFETSAAGGMDMTCWGLFSVPVNSSAIIRFVHANTSSNINISAGAIQYITRIGDNSTVRAV